MFYSLTSTTPISQLNVRDFNGLKNAENAAENSEFKFYHVGSYLTCGKKVVHW